MEILHSNINIELVCYHLLSPSNSLNQNEGTLVKKIGDLFGSFNGDVQGY